MEESIIDTQTFIAKDRGDSLESGVEHIFKMAKFKTERNVFISKYEIDVRAILGDRTIIIECKNYQNSNLTIRNLIHQWHSKNDIIKAHKVILVLAGLKINNSDYELASQFDMELWNENDISDLFNLSLKPDELRERLIEKISLKEITIEERYRDAITYLVIKPILSGMDLPEEYKFYCFNKWLRAFILTELQMIETTSSDRLNHIHLFEGSKVKKGFLNFKTKRKEKDYWFKVYTDLSSESILTKEIQDKYLSYMDSIVAEYNSQLQFFEGNDYLTKARKLISTRLQNAIYFGTDCSFTKNGMGGRIIVSLLEESDFEIRITQITEQESNALNWIVEADHLRVYNNLNNTTEYCWYFSSYNETVEKVFRILSEYYELSLNDNIIDISLETPYN
ncbi:MAG TPA: restriction endonuclease [Lutibacter sp.]